MKKPDSVEDTANTPPHDTLFDHQSTPEYEARMQRSIHKAAESGSFVPEHSPFLGQRIVLLEGTIDDDAASIAIAEMVLLNSQDSSMPIHLFVDSDGGYVAASLAIYDAVTKKGEYLTAPVYTYCRGRAHGTAALIVAGGAKRYRHALATSRLSIVPIKRGLDNSNDEEEVHQEMARMLQQLVAIVVERTDQPASGVRTDFDNGRMFNANQAKEYGLVDTIEAIKTDP